MLGPRCQHCFHCSICMASRWHRNNNCLWKLHTVFLMCFCLASCCLLFIITSGMSESRFHNFYLVTITTRSKKFSPKNNKDLGMACTSYSTSRKSKETRGNAITQPRSHPLKKCRIRDGWDRGWVMAFPLVSLLFREVEYDVQAIPKSLLFFGENFLLLVCELFRAHEMRSLW